jgi:hypothetical protein
LAGNRRWSEPPVIDRSLAVELEQYRGQWVAVDRGKVIAAGGSAPEVLALAADQRVSDPLVFHVPPQPDRRRFFSSLLQ